MNKDNLEPESARRYSHHDINSIASQQLLLDQRYKQEKLHLGNVRPIIHADWQGYKWVAVGNSLFYSKKYKTFHDFLMSYLPLTIGEEWGNAEIKKPLRDRHSILQWYDYVCEFQRRQKIGEDGIYSVVPNGAFHEYLCLAYDLYTLRHHSSLQQSLISRLKQQSQFQGARHEVFAAATCIRAGFSLEFEDELDKTKKHPEFIAIHKYFKESICVEAKSRHRPGVLNFPGEIRSLNETRVQIGRLLSEALKKPSPHPYVIFIDLNLPPASGEDFDEKWLREIVSTVNRHGGKSEKDPDLFNLIILTNHPSRYAPAAEPYPSGRVLSVFSHKPQKTPDNPEMLLGIASAAKISGDIPGDFTDNT